MIKKNLVLLFGGQSSEHDVSCKSVVTVFNNVDVNTFNVILVGITVEGQWLLVDSIEKVKDNTWINGKVCASILPDATKKELVVFDKNVTSIKLDVVFPVLHGLYGEDGTVQGLLELAQIPYVGCGVLASAVSMDKIYTKIIVDKLGIRQAEYVDVRVSELAKMEEVIGRIESKLQYPVFVKPSNAGSSKGVSKADNKSELIDSLNEASKHDNKILVEETIVGRELECAVLGGNDPKASGVGEILAADDAAFYDFDAKYNNAQSKTVVNPDLPEGVEKQIREDAVKIFKAVNGFGLSRVDFFYKLDTKEVVFNEINTLPGFTNISMYPVLWEAKGISTKELVAKLISIAFNR